MADGQGRGGAARLLPWRRGDEKPDRGAVVCFVSEVTAQDGHRHVVEFHALVGQPGLQGGYWLVRSSFASDGALVAYNCRRYVADGGRTTKGLLALQAARSELTRHGRVIHREPCPHCHLGMWRQEPAVRFVHAATDQPQCPDGQGNDCNEWKPQGFGDLPPWPPTGSCW